MVRITYSTRRTLLKYRKNKNSVTTKEYFSIKQYLDNQGNILEKHLKTLSREPYIRWTSEMYRLLDNPNNITCKTDHQRRERLVNAGYLKKKSRGFFIRTSKETCLLNKKTLCDLIFESNSSVEFSTLTERHRASLLAAKKLWTTYVKKAKDLKLQLVEEENDCKYKR